MNYILSDHLATVQRSDGAFIPLDLGNRDCRKFLKEWRDGALVTNADGTTAAYTEAAVEALGLTPPA